MRGLKKIKIVGATKKFFCETRQFIHLKWRSRVRKEPQFEGCSCVLEAPQNFILGKVLGDAWLLLLPTDPETGDGDFPLRHDTIHTASPFCSPLPMTLAPLRKGSLLARLPGRVVFSAW